MRAETPGLREKPSETRRRKKRKKEYPYAVELLRADHPVSVVVERAQQVLDDLRVLGRTDRRHGVEHDGLKRGVRQSA